MLHRADPSAALDKARFNYLRHGITRREFCQAPIRQRSEKAGGLIVWGAIVAVFSILSIVMNLINGDDFSIISVLTGVAVPALYIVGAVLNAKADAPQGA